MLADWTVTQTLEFIANRYRPGEQQRALGDIRQKARSAKIKISGRRCVWRLFGGPTDVQEREEILPLVWVDNALCQVAGKWAAANEWEHREFEAYKYNKILGVARRRSDAEIKPGIRALLPPKERAELQGWCDVRIERAGVPAAFPKPPSPTTEENIAYLRKEMMRIFQFGNPSTPVVSNVPIDAAAATGTHPLSAKVEANTGDAPMTDPVEALAEWIFEQHPLDGRRPKKRSELEQLALTEVVVDGFTTREFRNAFRKIYDTKAHHPPVSGWPLRQPFKSRLENL
jgi:hypothetical protein